MGFWVFMLLCNLIIPLTMVGGGLLFVKNPPKTINSFYGYRTRRSSQSKDAWIFAHHYCGRLWFWVGCLLLPITVVGMLFLIGGDADTVGFGGGMLCLVQGMLLVLTIPLTESALKKKFYH